MRPKSRPYWKGHMDMRVQAARHFQWSLILHFWSWASSGGDLVLVDEADFSIASAILGCLERKWRLDEFDEPGQVKYETIAEGF